MTGSLSGPFHAFCLRLLRQDDPELAVAGEEQRDRIMKRLFPALKPENIVAIKQELAAHYQRICAGAGGR